MLTSNDLARTFLAISLLTCFQWLSLPGCYSLPLGLTFYPAVYLHSSPESSRSSSQTVVCVSVESVTLLCGCRHKFIGISLTPTCSFSTHFPPRFSNGPSVDGQIRTTALLLPLPGNFTRSGSCSCSGLCAVRLKMSAGMGQILL